jgi:hypothetical protein
MATRRKIKDIGIDAKLRRMLKQPIGTPVVLTREEAIAIVEAGRGGRPDLPSGSEYVQKVSKIWRGIMPHD